MSTDVNRDFHDTLKKLNKIRQQLHESLHKYRQSFQIIQEIDVQVGDLSDWEDQLLKVYCLQQHKIPQYKESIETVRKNTSDLKEALKDVQEEQRNQLYQEIDNAQKRLEETTKKWEIEFKDENQEEEDGQ